MANNFVTMALKGIEFKPSNVLSPADKELRGRLIKLGAFVRRSARPAIFGGQGVRHPANA